MKNLNFNNIQKKYLTITLNDDNKTTIMVMSPTKKVMDLLMQLQSSNDINNPNMEELDTLYEICSVVMSRNKGGIKVSKELLEEIFDIEDIIMFLSEYMQFMQTQLAIKN